jgi:hypothetical protein
MSTINTPRLGKWLGMKVIKCDNFEAGQRDKIDQIMAKTGYLFVSI